MVTQSLNGTWRFRAAGEADWLPAQVPGTVLADLLENGRIPDPYYRTNEYAARELFRQDYEYSLTFGADPALLEKQQVELVCLGLDTLATLTLNGGPLAVADNMHRTWRFEVKNQLQPGENTLLVRFASPLKGMEQAMEQSADDNFMVPVGCMAGNSYLRKVHSQLGWDWGPQLPDAGIWRGIRLEGFSNGRLDSVRLHQTHAKGHVLLDCTPEVADAPAGAAAALQAKLFAPDGTLVAAASGGDADTLTLRVDAPQLWWPNGYGEQPLYRLEVTRTAGDDSDSWERKVGLRTLTVSTEADEWGSEFCFMVNGVKIFAMGANYIPEDSILARVTPQRTRQLVQDSVAAHYNCLRVWGGGYYPDDFFFDLCDEYGLIVWQDLMFACNAYSFTPEFEASVAAEARDNVRRIRHHACLGLWCGNNEMESAWEGWDDFKGLSPKLKADYIRQFEHVLPRVVAENDPDTFYWLSSPSSGGGFDYTEDPNRGDVHYWKVWHGRLPFSDYRNHYFRFCSEFGFQAFPGLDTVKRYTEKQDRNIFSAVMESHQKNGAANGLILYYLSETFLYPKDFDSLLYVSQLLQAEAIRTGVEHWRRHRGRCMGALYWQLNDCWPVASWASIDYYGSWKALHYAARRFFQPTTLSVEEKGTALAYHLVNESRQPFAGTLTVRLCTDDFSELERYTLPVEAEALSAHQVTELDFAAPCAEHGPEALYAAWELTGADGQPVAQGCTLFVQPKHHRYQPASYTLEVADAGEALAISVKASCFCQFAELRLPGADGVVFSDNYFPITSAAGVAVTVDKARLPDGMDAAALQAALQLRSLVDSYSVK